MKTKKRWISGLLTAVMLFSLCACSSTDTGSGDAGGETAEGGSKPVSELKVGVVMKSFDEFQQAVMDGATAAAGRAGLF